MIVVVIKTVLDNTLHEQHNTKIAVVYNLKKNELKLMKKHPIHLTNYFFKCKLIIGC